MRSIPRFSTTGKGHTTGVQTPGGGPSGANGGGLAAVAYEQDQRAYNEAVAALDVTSIEFQGHRVTVNKNGMPVQGGGIRGKVKGFSRASRKNLMDLIASLEPQAAKGCRHVGLFVTLTYAGAEADLPDASEVKRHLDTFLKRLLRAYPQGSGVWRYEWESSGARSYHPHLHLIVFGVPFLPKEWVQAAWNEVAGNPAGSPSTKVDGLKSWRGAMWYAGKYVGKVSEVVDGGDDGGDDAPKLVYGAYLTGRVWGIFNKEVLPYGKLEEIEIDSQSQTWFYQFRRLGRRRWQYLNHGNGGFTLYVDDVGGWRRALLWCLAQYGG